MGRHAWNRLQTALKKFADIAHTWVPRDLCREWESDFPFNPTDCIDWDGRLPTQDWPPYIEGTDEWDNPFLRDDVDIEKVIGAQGRKETTQEREERERLQRDAEMSEEEEESEESSRWKESEEESD